MAPRRSGTSQKALLEGIAARLDEIIADGDEDQALLALAQLTQTATLCSEALDLITTLARELLRRGWSTILLQWFNVFLTHRHAQLLQDPAHRQPLYQIIRHTARWALLVPSCLRNNVPLTLLMVESGPLREAVMSTVEHCASLWRPEQLETHLRAVLSQTSLHRFLGCAEIVDAWLSHHTPATTQSVVALIDAHATAISEQLKSNHHTIFPALLQRLPGGSALWELSLLHMANTIRQRFEKMGDACFDAQMYLKQVFQLKPESIDLAHQLMRFLLVPIEHAANCAAFEAMIRHALTAETQHDALRFTAQICQTLSFLWHSNIVSAILASVSVIHQLVFAQPTPPLHLFFSILTRGLAHLMLVKSTGFVYNVVDPPSVNHSRDCPACNFLRWAVAFGEDEEELGRIELLLLEVMGSPCPVDDDLDVLHLYRSWSLYNASWKSTSSLHLESFIATIHHLLLSSVKPSDRAFSPYMQAPVPESWPRQCLSIPLQVCHRIEAPALKPSEQVASSSQELVAAETTADGFSQRATWSDDDDDLFSQVENTAPTRLKRTSSATVTQTKKRRLGVSICPSSLLPESDVPNLWSWRAVAFTRWTLWAASATPEPGQPCEDMVSLCLERHVTLTCRIEQGQLSINGIDLTCSEGFSASSFPTESLAQVAGLLDSDNLSDGLTKQDYAFIAGILLLQERHHVDNNLFRESFIDRMRSRVIEILMSPTTDPCRLVEAFPILGRARLVRLQAADINFTLTWDDMQSYPYDLASLANVLCLKQSLWMLSPGTDVLAPHKLCLLAALQAAGDAQPSVLTTSLQDLVCQGTSSSTLSEIHFEYVAAKNKAKFLATMKCPWPPPIAEVDAVVMWFVAYALLYGSNGNLSWGKRWRACQFLSLHGPKAPGNVDVAAWYDLADLQCLQAPEDSWTALCLEYCKSFPAVPPLMAKSSKLFATVGLPDQTAHISDEEAEETFPGDAVVEAFDVYRNHLETYPRHQQCLKQLEKLSEKVPSASESTSVGIQLSAACVEHVCARLDAVLQKRPGLRNSSTPSQQPTPCTHMLDVLMYEPPSKLENSTSARVILEEFEGQMSFLGYMLDFNLSVVQRLVEGSKDEPNNTPYVRRMMTHVKHSVWVANQWFQLWPPDLGSKRPFNYAAALVNLFGSFSRKDQVTESFQELGRNTLMYMLPWTHRYVGLLLRESPGGKSTRRKSTENKEESTLNDTIACILKTQLEEWPECVFHELYPYRSANVKIKMILDCFQGAHDKLHADMVAGWNLFANLALQETSMTQAKSWATRLRTTNDCPIFTSVDPFRAGDDYCRLYQCNLTNVTVMCGKSQPKLVQVLDQFGQSHKVLCKSSDDLRQDKIVQTVFKLIEILFEDRINTYNVVPMTLTAGLIQCIDSADTISDLLFTPSKTKYGGRACHEFYHPDNLSLHRCHELLTKCVKTNTSTLSQQRYQVFTQEICAKFRTPMKQLLWENFPTQIRYVRGLTNFAKSVGTTSALCHVYGIGDRHLKNMLWKKRTGELCHIDFGYMFEKGRVLRQPEIVPFRLTRFISNCASVEGVLVPYVAQAMGVLKRNTDALVATTSIFANHVIEFIDPIDSRKEASKVLTRVSAQSHTNSLQRR